MATQRRSREFINHLNQNNLGLTFTYHTHPTTIDYLDIIINGNTDGTIATTNFFKKVDSNGLDLDLTSRFQKLPPQTMAKEQTEPFCQFKRLRNCTTDKDFLAQSQTFRSRFKAKGYPDKLIEGAIKRALNTPHEDCLKPSSTKGPKKSPHARQFHH